MVLRRVLLKNVLDPSTWSLVETLRNASVALDDDGNVIAIPTFNINPQNSPIPAGGSIGNVSIKDGSAATLASVIGTPNPIGSAFPTLSNGLFAVNVPFLWNQANGSYDAYSEADAFSTVVLPNAGSTTLIAAGGASKKYKIYEAWISAAAVSGNVTINEATSGALIIGVQPGSASGAEALHVVFGPNGVLQPNANNAIQVTTAGAQVGYAGIVYGAAH